jgi:F0F1-type ATP synthase assembly protein I
VHLVQNKVGNGHLYQVITVRMRLVDTLFYGLSLILGYSLMLIVMTFNAGLVLVVIAGYCCGRFFFHRKTQLLQQFASVKRSRNDSDSDHCHIRS